jgi:hypothetical protein
MKKELGRAKKTAASVGFAAGGLFSVWETHGTHFTEKADKPEETQKAG